MKYYHYSNSLLKKIFIDIKGKGIKHFIIGLLWFIFWMIIYGITVCIQPEFIFIPMVFNLPLACFFLTGIILETLFIYYSNIDYYYDIFGKIFVLVFTYGLNYYYREFIDKGVKPLRKKLKLRIKEFFIWFIPWIILISILSRLSSILL